VNLDVNLLASADDLLLSSGNLHATLKARGLYNTFQFVLRLSPEVHRRLDAHQMGISSSDKVDFNTLEAFSTYLHETIHWWQHVGSTYGLMLSLSHPAQSQANYTHLKNLVAEVGFQKPIQALIGQNGRAGDLANIIVNNSFDISSFRNLTLSPVQARGVVNAPLFESVGHAYKIAYGNNVLLLGASADPEFEVLPHPKDWHEGFGDLKTAKVEGFFYGSPVGLPPLGAREIFEGQARFGQLQYLYFATGGRLTWDDVISCKLLSGVYGEAFNWFLKFSELSWPENVDHPTVGLFLLVCDMSINPGAGFPFSPIFFDTFISDTDPGLRFLTLCRMVALKCPHVATAIQTYSRDEYEAVSNELASAAIISSPLQIASTVSSWKNIGRGIRDLMNAHATFQYSPGNLVPCVLLSHYLSFSEDKYTTPEYFCWPGAWMAGGRVSEQALTLFNRHSALFCDKADDDGIFPRKYHDRADADVQKTFDTFYAVNLTYDMTRQWIMDSGAFIYDYSWLSQRASPKEMKDFADSHFQMLFDVHPDAVKIL